MEGGEDYSTYIKIIDLERLVVAFIRYGINKFGMLNMSHKIQKNEILD